MWRVQGGAIELPLPSITYPGHPRPGVTRSRDLYSSCGSTQTSDDLLGPSTPENSRGYTFAERFPNDTRKRQQTSNFGALLSAMDAERNEIPTGPKKHMANLPTPRSKPGSGLPKLPKAAESRDSPAAGLQSPPCARLKWGKRDQGHNFPLPEVSLKAGSHASTNPREGSTSSIDSHRLAPRAKRKPAVRARTLASTQCSSREHHFRLEKCCRYSHKEREETDFPVLRKERIKERKKVVTTPDNSRTARSMY